MRPNLQPSSQIFINKFEMPIYDCDDYTIPAENQQPTTIQTRHRV